MILIEGSPSVRGTPKKVKPEEKKDPSSAKPKAKVADIKKNLPPAKPNTKVGDVLKEYKKNIEAAYKRVVQAKTTATQNVKQLTEQQFRDVNAQIDAYNKFRDETRTATGAYFDSAPRLTRIDPSILPKKKQEKDPDPSLENTPTIAGKWVARSGESILTYDIKDDGTLYLSIKNPYFGQGKHGMWRQQGNVVSAKFVDSGAPGTGGFSKGRDLNVRIISADRIEIDGATATRSR